MKQFGANKQMVLKRTSSACHIKYFGQEFGPKLAKNFQKFQDINSLFYKRKCLHHQTFCEKTSFHRRQHRQFLYTLNLQNEKLFEKYQVSHLLRENSKIISKM